MVRFLTRRSVLAGGFAVPAAVSLNLPSMAGPGSVIWPKAGINLASAEFGRVPGTYDVDYNYPGERHLDYFASLGMGLVRLPFRWERLQPELFATFDKLEMERLTTFVGAARSRKYIVVLDPHNYAKRYLSTDHWRTEHLIGSTNLPQKAFVDFWARLAQVFRGDDDVWFGLMNEPNDISAEYWLTIVDAAIAAIRAEGANNLILVPGTNWTGAHSWLQSGNGIMSRVRDAANNFAFEVHQYFDANSSGQSANAVSATVGVERIAAFEAWARSNGFRAFLGEFGLADNTVSLDAGRNLLQALGRSRDVWIGWAAWAGGPRWPEDSIFLLEPYRDGSIRPQMRVLQEAAARLDQNFSDGR